MQPCRNEEVADRRSSLDSLLGLRTVARPGVEMCGQHDGATRPGVDSTCLHPLQPSSAGARQESGISILTPDGCVQRPCLRGSTAPGLTQLGNSSVATTLCAGMGSLGMPSSAASMTSLYGKLRTAAVTTYPAVATAGGDLSCGSHQDCFSTASSTGSAAYAWQHQKPTIAASGDATSLALTSQPMLHPKSSPLQYSLSSGSNAPARSYTSSSSSRSTVSSCRLTDQSGLGCFNNRAAAVPCGPAVCQNTLSALPTSQPDLLMPDATLRLSSTGDEHALHALLMAAAAAQNQIPASTAPGIADAAAAGADLPGGLAGAHPSVYTPEQALLVQQLLGLGQAQGLDDNSTDAASLLALLNNDPQPQQQLPAVQYNQPSALPGTAPTPTDSSGMFDMSTLQVPALAAGLHSLQQDALPLPGLDTLLGALRAGSAAPAAVDDALLLFHTAQQQLPGYISSSSSSSALSMLHTLLGLAQTPAQHNVLLAHLMPQLAASTGFEGSSYPHTLPGSIHSLLTNPPAVNTPALLGTGGGGGRSAVAAALEALQHKLVLGTTGLGNTAAGVFRSLAGLAAAHGAAGGCGGAGGKAAQGTGPGANPMYKTELCRTWLDTGGCRYGARCQFAHGASELRPIQRHPKYKTQPCRTFSVQGVCPYGDRCNFIHDMPVTAPNLLMPQSSGGSSSSSSCSGSTRASALTATSCAAAVL